MKFIPTALSSKVARQALVAQKHSPTLLFAGGVVGVVTSTVLACKATLKVEDVLTDIQAKKKMVKAADANPDYSEDDARRDLVLIHVQGAVALGKLYAPAIGVGVASIAALTTSHRILTRRNAALTAAYAAVDKAFKSYREKVVSAYGEDVDRSFMYETEKAQVEEDGKKKTVKRVNKDSPLHSPYAKFFDEYNQNWSKEPEYNFLFLTCQQNYFNDLLNARGHVFLNEVYEKLGIEHTKAGAVVGWVRNNGDGFIDFGLLDDREAVREFVNGREGSILLDFNVDGVIYDLIENKEPLAWQS